MPFREVAALKVADAVVEQIEDMLAHCVLRPGDALPSERALADEMGVSRASLRLALEKLVARGLLERRQDASLAVADGLDVALSEPLESLIGTRPDALDDFVSFRRLLEREAARQAAQRAAQSDLERLKAIAEQLQAAHVDDDETHARMLDYELHMTIAEASGNLITAHVSRALRRALRRALQETRFVALSQPGARAQLLEQHLELIRAIRARDPDAAAAASDAHIDFISAALSVSRSAVVDEARAALRPDRLRKAGPEDDTAE